MDWLRQDLKYALRALTTRPGFSLLAILTLAVGIGANTVAFDAVNALLFKPRRLADVKSLGWLIPRGGGGRGTSWPDYLHYARGNRAFGEIAAEGRLPFSMRADGRAEQASALLVSSNYLSLLRVRPEMGRLFTEADLRETEIPAVVSHRFWADRLAGRTLAGAAIALGGRSVSIVGVLPDSFQGPGGLYEPDVWLPLERMDALGVQPELRESTPWLTLIGRLRGGITAVEAQADLDGLTAALGPADRAARSERKMTFVPMTDGHPDLQGLTPSVWIAMAIVGVVLLIACFNVAGLLLARASERQTEMAVRAAMGARRSRIVRQLVTEGLVLAALAGATSLVIAVWSADLLSAFSLPAPIPQRLHVGIDARLVAFTISLVLVAGVLPAVLPALQTTGVARLTSLRSQSETGPPRSRVRSAFVVAQVAGSTTFLCAALLFVRSYWIAAHHDTGFETDHAVVMELTPARFGYDPVRARALVEDLLERIRAIPGITHAAVADRVPFYIGLSRTLEFSAEASRCSTPECRTATVYAVGDRHFAALGVPLRAGRDFTADDARAGTAVVIGEAMASRLWPGGPAVGRRLRDVQTGRQMEVIGVAADITHRSVRERPGSYLYRTLRADEYAAAVSLVARTGGDPRMVVGSLQDQLAALDPALPARVRTMAQRMELPLWPARTAAGFLLICGVLAVILATVGLFGVTYYTISQRTREFGIRVALGATSRGVVSLVLREALVLTLPGVLLGTLGALVAGRFASHMLFGVRASDPLTFAAAAVLQGLVALAACAGPARRATRTDPMVALRSL